MKTERLMNKRYIYGFVFAEIFILAESINPCIILDENQWLYTSSTIAQVVATVMGLLLAGYQYYEDQFSRKIEQDETLKESIEETKKNFHSKLSFLTPIILCDVLLCIISIISWHTNGFILRSLSNFCFNNSILLFIFSLLLVVSFVSITTEP